MKTLPRSRVTLTILELAFCTYDLTHTNILLLIIIIKDALTIFKSNITILTGQIHSSNHDEVSLDNLSQNISNMIFTSLKKIVPSSNPKGSSKLERRRKIMNMIKVKRKQSSDYVWNHDHHTKRPLNQYTQTPNLKRRLNWQLFKKWNKTCHKINNETNSLKCWKLISRATNPSLKP